MSFGDTFRMLTVKVNKGSGCIFQTDDKNHTYVLTARHNIDESDAVEIKRTLLGSDSKLIEENLEFIGKPYYHSNVNIDAAICKIRKIEGVPHLKKCDFQCLSKEDIYLCGHPEVREDEDSFRVNKIKVLNRKDLGYMEGELTPVVTQSEISGQSGGGILFEKNGSPVLVGIQKGMAADDEDEELSRVNFLPYEHFDDIVSQHSEELSHLSPSFISSFNEVIAATYDLNNFPLNKDLVKNELHAVAEDISSSISPKDILNCFGSQRMLVSGEPQSSVYDSQLWIGMLELLTVIQINKGEELLTIDDIHIMNKKNKVIFGSVVSSWSELISALYKSDLTELEKGGKIFIVTSNDTSPAVTTLDPKIVKSIANVPPKRIKVNRASVTAPFEDIELKHIYDIQKKFMDHMVNYIHANATNIEDLLKDEAKQIV
ncbi:ABC-three component system protein [Photobacterium sanguinicancri]|uniref:Trypsin-like peptidase domain-containing protein n=1 Tax=Photobacterium sanguinicancri TaxID=875932 RepID=A0AAW7YAE9_9GAMM|nr:ABC-three component system protein [Photobacterium sanguinicancri]MDO6545206.1 trypsin-like peptidase domain-containing protein [Photobacterium sanguinicancri]